jgi:DNA primase catalytic subunit
MTNPRAVDVTNAINFSPIDIVRKLSHGNRNEILHYIEEVSLEVLRKKREREFERERREKERREQDRLRELENENNKMEDIGNSSKGKKKWLGLGLGLSKKDKNNDISNQENESTERKTNITNSPPPKESIEVEPAHDSDVWV